MHGTHIHKGHTERTDIKVAQNARNAQNAQNLQNTENIQDAQLTQDAQNGNYRRKCWTLISPNTKYQQQAVYWVLVYIIHKGRRCADCGKHSN